MSDNKCDLLHCCAATFEIHNLKQRLCFLKKQKKGDVYERVDASGHEHVR